MLKTFNLGRGVIVSINYQTKSIKTSINEKTAVNKEYQDNSKVKP